MRLASKYHWDAVLSFHATVLDRIEAGLANWGDDFSEIERFDITESNHLPTKPPTASDNNTHSTANTSHRQRNYCREWNRTGSGSNSSHQQGVKH